MSLFSLFCIFENKVEMKTFGCVDCCKPDWDPVWKPSILNISWLSDDKKSKHAFLKEASVFASLSCSGVCQDCACFSVSNQLLDSSFWSCLSGNRLPKSGPEQLDEPLLCARPSGLCSHQTHPVVLCCHDVPALHNEISNEKYHWTIKGDAMSLVF